MFRRTLLPFVALSFLALTLVSLPEINAQPRTSQPMMPNVNPALFKGLRYRLVGPSRGGRVTTVTGVPSQPKTFYMCVASGGLFRTPECGGNWRPIAVGK